MRGDIIRDRRGWFFHDNGGGTLDNLSESNPDETPKKVTSVPGPTVILVRDGQPTGEGDPLARRVALVLAKRYQND